MILYSEHESKDYNVRFGRIDIDSTFQSWDLINAEIIRQKFDFIRLKIRNPNSEQTQHFHQLCKQLHLLEILRVYAINHDQLSSIHFDFGTYSFKKVQKNDVETLLKIIHETYEDIPFGNYTPPSILHKFPIDVQLKNLISYYRHEYSKESSTIESHFICNKEEIVGCIITTVSNNTTYTNYVGILKSHRNKHVLTTTINFIQYDTFHKRFPDGGGGAARLSNLHSQKAFESNNMTFIGYDFIYLLEL